MKLCHAGALALMGWYLIAPPKTSSWEWWWGNPPLSQWDQLGAYDSAEKCETAKAARELQDALAESASLPAGALRATTLPDQDYVSGGKRFTVKGGYLYPEGGPSGAAALATPKPPVEGAVRGTYKGAAGWFVPKANLFYPDGAPTAERVADRPRCIETTDPRLAK